MMLCSQRFLHLAITFLTQQPGPGCHLNSTKIDGNNNETTQE